MNQFIEWLQWIGVTMLHVSWMIVIVGVFHRLLHGLLSDRPNRQYLAGLTVLLLVSGSIPMAMLLSHRQMFASSNSLITSAENSRTADPNVGAAVAETSVKTEVTADLSSQVYATGTDGLASSSTALPELAGIPIVPVPRRTRSEYWQVAGALFTFVSPLVTIVYVVGLLWMIARLLSNWGRCHRLVAGGKPIESGELWETVVRLCRQQHLKIQPMLRLSDEVLTPVLVGFLRPCILLPTALATGLTANQVETILLHELVHVARKDQWVLLWQATLETILFFHPSIWAINRRLHESREHCCDDQVLQSGISPIKYAQVLLSVAQSGFDRQESLRESALGNLATGFTGKTSDEKLASNGNELVRRVRRILKGSHRESMKFRVAMLLGGRGVISFLLLISLAGFLPVAGISWGHLNASQDVQDKIPMITFSVFDSDGNPVEDLEWEVKVIAKFGGVLEPPAQTGDKPNQVLFQYHQFFYRLWSDKGAQPVLQRVKGSQVVFKSKRLNQAVIWQFDGSEGEPPMGEITVQLQPCNVLEGQVINGIDKRPLKDATVTYLGKIGNLPWLYNKVPSVRTDANGRFRLSGVPVGMQAFLQGEKEGFRKTTSLGTEVAADNLSDIRLELLPTDLPSKVVVPNTDGLELLDALSVLTEAYQDGRKEMYARLDEVKDPGEREKVRAMYSPTAPFFQAIRNIADANPGTQAELEALVWCCQYGDRTTSKGVATVKEVADRLLQNYSNRPEILPCLDVLIGIQKHRLEVCRRLMNENPSRLVQGNVLRIEAQLCEGTLEADDRMRDMFFLTGNRVSTGDRIGLEGQRIPFRREMLTEEKREKLIADQLVRLEKLISVYGDLPHFHDKTLANWGTIRKHYLLNLCIGSKALDVTGKLITGEDYRLSDHDGKIKIVFFWGSWCSPCHQELPELNHIHEKLGDKVEIIGIMSETDEEAAKKDILEYGVKFSNIVEYENRDDRFAAQPNHVQWAVNSWPTIFIIDQYNRIQFNKFSRRVGHDNLLRRIDVLIKREEELQRTR